jgi:hypothetical protein
MDKRAGEMMTVRRYGSGVCLKVEPNHLDRDAGIYNIRINLEKEYEYQISERTRFTCHLEGYAARWDSTEASGSNGTDPWSDPVASARLDNDRTPSVGAKFLPCMTRW